MPPGHSFALPPIRVDQRSVFNLGSSLLTNTSRLPRTVRFHAFSLVGKSPDSVKPVTYTLPPSSTATASIDSHVNDVSPVPPRNVQAITDSLPLLRGSILTMHPSLAPPRMPC